MKQKYKNRIVILIAAMMAFLLIIPPMNAYADESDDGSSGGIIESIADAVGGVVDAVGDIISGDSEDEDSSGGMVIAGPMLDVIFGSGIADNDSVVGDPLNILQKSIDIIITVIEGGTTTVDVGDTTGAVENEVSTEGIINQPIYRVFQAISITIILFYFMSGLITKDLSQTFGRPTMEQVIKPFARLLVCFLFALNAWPIMKLFLLLSQFAFYQIPDVSSALGGDMSSVKQQLVDASGYMADTWNPIKMLANLMIEMKIVLLFIIPYLISIVVQFAAIWVVFSRTVNICLMAAFGPLAMSDLYDDKPLKDTRAFDYVRKFAGLCFESVVIALTYYVVNQICSVYISAMIDRVLYFTTNAGGQLQDDGWSQFMNVALYVSVLKLVQVGAVIAAARKAKEIFGTS